MYLLAEKGLLKGLQFKFEEGEEWTLGRDPHQSTFLLNDPSLADCAVKITRTPEDLFFIENLGDQDAVLVNGRRVEEPLLLSENDRIQIGDTTFRFAVEPNPEQNLYDDIFDSLENPEIPPEPGPIEELDLPESMEPPIERPAKEEEQNSYDTIFEDLSGEAELPFPMLAESQSPLLLKVISGPNAGAEIALEKGRSYLIGKDPNSCDIVFNDLSVSRNHARLSVSEEGILDLEDLDSKNGTVVNGSRIAGKTFITTQHLVQMGTTIFLILDREAMQETIYAPPPYETPKPTPEEIEQELAAAEQLEEESIDWKSKKIPGKHLVLAGSFASLLFIIGITFFSLFKSEQVELAHKMPHERLKDALVDFPCITYSFNPATGKLFITGHVLTQVAHQELLYHLHQVPSITSIEDSVVIDETVWKMMNDLLASNPNWRSVSLLSSKPGCFVVRGYVQNLEQATQLSDFLTKNFPYGDRLQNKVAIEDAMNIEIVSLLQSKGFGSVVPQLANGEVILLGRYSEHQQKEYKELIDQLCTIPGVAIVKNSAVPVSPLAASINVTEQYKVTGSVFHDHKGFGVVINGRIVTIGEILDGMKLISIESNTILLEKDGLRYKIDYAQ